MVKEITCFTGEVILVDDEDYPLLSRHTWYMTGEKGNQYAATKVPNREGKIKSFCMHNFIVPLAVNVDHEDMNTFNNQKYNLRPATWQLNQWNKGKPKSGRYGVPSSKYKGVSYRPLRGKDRWLAQFKYVEEGKHKSTGYMVTVGYFWDEVEAAKAYNKKVKEMRGEYAWVNPIPEEINQGNALNT